MGPMALGDNKNIHRQNQIKPCGSWQYIEVLRHEKIRLCKNSIYIIFLPLIHRNVQLPWARPSGAWRVNVLWHSRSMRGSGLNNEWRIRATDRFCACIYYATLMHHAPGCCECAQDSWTLQWIRGKKLYKYCSVSCTDRLFRVLRP